jgi:hypothetical protein
MPKCARWRPASATRWAPRGSPPRCRTSTSTACCSACCGRWRRARVRGARASPTRIGGAAAGRGPVALVSSPAHLKRLPAGIDWHPGGRTLSALFSSGGPLPMHPRRRRCRRPPACCRSRSGAAPRPAASAGAAAGSRTRRSRPCRACPSRGEDGALSCARRTWPGWLAAAGDRGDWMRRRLRLRGRDDRIVKIGRSAVFRSAPSSARRADGRWLSEVRVVPPG